MRGRHAIFVVVILASVVYFFFEARGILFTPPLYIVEPQDGEIIHTTRIHIAGSTDAGQRVVVRGQEFLADKNGNFSGMLTVGPEYQELGFLVRDRFGNERHRVVKIIVE